MPDKIWQLDVLSSFAQQDEIFKKSYLPPPKKSKLSEIKAVKLHESFLHDLHENMRRMKRLGLRMVADGLTQQRIQRLKAIQKQLANRILT